MDASIRWGRLVIAGLAIVVFFTGLGSARLWDRDEPRNARCAQEMSERGDWIVPTFDGELRTHKPILLYWMQIVSYKILGANEWGARVPSACCGVVTVLACYGIAARLVSPVAGLWSALILSTSVMFVVASRAATPDGPLICCSTFAIYLFVRFAFKQDQTAASTEFLPVRFVIPNFSQWTAIYAACALAVLAKGPVGFVLPATVVGAMMVWQLGLHPAKRQGSRFSRTLALTKQGLTSFCVSAWNMRPVTAIATVLLIAGPWYLAVGMATEGVWLREFFWTHNVSRAVTTMEGHSGPPLLFYFLTLCVGTFPWSIWMFPTTLYLWQVWHERPDRQPAIVLGLAWIGVYLGCFSLAATKLPSYLTPCYPGAAMLYGMLISQWARDRKVLLGWSRVGLVISTVVGLGLATSVGFIRIGGNVTLTALAPAGFMLLIAAVAAAKLMALRQPALGLRFYTVGAIGMVVLLAALGPILVDDSRKDLDLLAKYLREDRARVGFIGDVEPSWIFYANGRSDKLAPTDWEAAAIDYLSSSVSHQILLTSDQASQLKVFLQENRTEVVLETLQETPDTLRNTKFQAIRLRANPLERVANRNLDGEKVKR